MLFTAETATEHGGEGGGSVPKKDEESLAWRKSLERISN